MGLRGIMNVSEYLEQLQSVGVHENDLPVIQPLFQARIWECMVPGEGPERLAEVIKQLWAEDERFHMEGGSWTNNVSWVQGYDTVLVPMERASSLFHERITCAGYLGYPFQYMCTDDELYLNLFLSIHIIGKFFHSAYYPLILERICQVASTSLYCATRDRCVGYLAYPFLRKRPVFRTDVPSSQHRQTMVLNKVDTVNSYGLR
jgi:hypothetical protein